MDWSTIIGVSFLALAFISVYKAGYYRGTRHQIEQQNANVRQAYTYSDYRAIDDKMNTNHYVDIINRTADEWSDGE
jgi:hypothetical protein